MEIGGKKMIELILGLILGYVFRDFIGYFVRMIKKGLEQELKQYEQN